MDERGTSASAAAATTAAGRNATPATPPLSTLVHPTTSSLLIFAFINSATTIVCTCLTAVCVLTGLGLAGYWRRREHLLSDRLAVAADTFWAIEPDVEQLLRLARRISLTFSDLIPKVAPRRWVVTRSPRVTVGDRSFATAGPGFLNSLPENRHVATLGQGGQLLPSWMLCLHNVPLAIFFYTLIFHHQCH